MTMLAKSAARDLADAVRSRPSTSPPNNSLMHSEVSMTNFRTASANSSPAIAIGPLRDQRHLCQDGRKRAGDESASGRDRRIREVHGAAIARALHKVRADAARRWSSCSPDAFRAGPNR